MEVILKRCSVCSEEKDTSEFYTNGDGRPKAECKRCNLAKRSAYRLQNLEKFSERNKRQYAKNAQARRDDSKARYSDNRDHVLEKSRQYRQENREIVVARQKQWRQQLRCEMLDAYGNKCSCCGEMEPKFLTLEHTRRDGADHRRELGSQVKVYTDLRRKGWPTDGFGLLCWNCNCATADGSICPHKLRDQSEN